MRKYAIMGVIYNNFSKPISLFVGEENSMLKTTNNLELATFFFDKKALKEKLKYLRKQYDSYCWYALDTK